ncbi:hypothetical protein F5972_31065 [Microbispora cellulosiformans]|uniref:META domain-containing protein n=1 Tax=Microbispora cellulosiformans TaxID=2614688 RepID=A0A5J5JTP3_9ACTN|nr:hypothetical protein [Microbispora cellulosiformans]KAA9374674.1 hypothetical protein F5972_31065 [Microbispora cellulosiformans]
MRLLASTATLGLIATGLTAAPAQASAAKVAYGWAWPDGKGKLRIVPRAAKPVTMHYGIRSFRLKPLAGAKEIRLDYSSASFYRTSVTCDARDNGGKYAVSAKGLGKTACAPGDLAFVLTLGPTLVRIAYSGTKASTIHQFWPGVATERPKIAFGTLRYLGDGTPGPSISGIVSFTPEGGKPMKLGYDWTAGFNRITEACNADWLTRGDPRNADEEGVGSIACDARQMTAVLKRLKRPVLVKVHYSPLAERMNQLWEVSRGA